MTFAECLEDNAEDVDGSYVRRMWAEDDPPVIVDSGIITWPNGTSTVENIIDANDWEKVA